MCVWKWVLMFEIRFDFSLPFEGNLLRYVGQVQIGSEKAFRRSDVVLEQHWNPTQHSLQRSFQNLSFWSLSLSFSALFWIWKYFYFLCRILCSLDLFLYIFILRHPYCLCFVFFYPERDYLHGWERGCRLAQNLAHSSIGQSHMRNSKNTHTH